MELAASSRWITAVLQILSTKETHVVSSFPQTKTEWLPSCMMKDRCRSREENQQILWIQSNTCWLPLNAKAFTVKLSPCRLWPIHAFKVFGWNEDAEAEKAEEAWRITLTRDKWSFPKIHLDHDESRHRSWKFLSKFATHQTIKLPIDSAINGDHLRPPALAALLALLAAQPEAINWERPRIDGNSQQHASALEKAYDTHCFWILHPKWLNRAAETRSKQKSLRPKNSSASPDLEKNQSTHAIVTALMENWSPTTQLSVEPTLPPRSFKAFELNIFAFQMGASGNKSHDRSVSS